MKKIILFALIFTACSNNASAYIDELNTLGYNDFSTEEEAENFAKKTCLQVELGEKTYGSKIEGLAIKNFCNEYYEEFRILTNDQILIEQLKETNLISKFKSESIAISSSKEFCKSLRGLPINLIRGPEEYKVSVKVLCPEFLIDFKIFSNEDLYIEKLEDNNLLNDFAAPRQAINLAYEKCNDIDNGDEPKGNLSEKIAVEIFCPEYYDSFAILRVIDVSGTFELNSDYSTYSGYSIGGTDSNCYGTGGYSDIKRSMNIVLKNTQGITLYSAVVTKVSRTQRSQCTFYFTFYEVVEGEEVYVFEVANRGEMRYTFDRLDSLGIAVSLGD
tara:strand:- start:112 stop:1101 length:990 start_codon:yes stop_codon:yes gene_type:complete